MNPRAVATALCAVGNVAGTRRPTAHDLKAIGAAGSDANFTSIVLDAALLYGIRLCFCFVIVDTPTPSSSSGPTFFSAIVRSSYLIFPSKSQLPA